MDYQELMFAVEVNKRAEELRQAARTAVERATASEHVDRRVTAMATWDAKYPKADFVKHAYREITEALKIINEQQAADSSARLDESLGLA